jgi:Zn-finger nucleic acid-binding protein
MTDLGYNLEDAYFHQKDLDMLARRRAKLAAQRSDSAVGRINCPRCGSDMTEVAIEHVKVDRCPDCGGVFLDGGELEMLTRSKSGGFFKWLLQTAFETRSRRHAIAAPEEGAINRP